MTQAKVEQLAAEITNGYEEVTRGLARMTKHLGADASEAITRSANKFVHAASDLAEQIQKQSAAFTKKGAEEVREHPTAAAAIAAAAVGLLGYAVTRSRQD